MPHRQPDAYGGTRFSALIAGLVVSQLVGTLFVRQSNHFILGQHQALSSEGWFAVPAGPAAETLTTAAAAVGGGLFYALSVGTALALTTWAVLQLYNCLFLDNRRLLLIPLAGWATLLWWLNANGITLFPTLFACCVPLVTAIAFGRPRSSVSNRTQSWLWCLPVLILIGLTALWSTQLNKGLFIAIRDHVLLSNPVGQKVNDFYYRYTLYAAEPFKSFNQKNIRTCKLEAFQSASMQKHLAERLAGSDVLAIEDSTIADLIVRQTKEGLNLVSPRGKSITVSQNDLLADTGQWLKAFSNMDDRHAAFRRLTFAGVLIGFPVLLYISVYSALRLLAGIFTSSARSATWMASGACLVVGVLLFLPMPESRTLVSPQEEINTVLSSDDWTRRVAALRQIEEHALEIARFPQYRRLLRSPRVVERYWLARALARSRSPETYLDLLTLMNDAQPNVVCQSYFALGRRGDRAAVETIKAKMVQSDHWYTQWYGYNAMRKLGWHQTESR